MSYFLDSWGMCQLYNTAKEQTTQQIARSWSPFYNIIVLELHPNAWLGEAWARLWMSPSLGQIGWPSHNVNILVLRTSRMTMESVGYKIILRIVTADDDLEWRYWRYNVWHYAISFWATKSRCQLLSLPMILNTQQYQRGDQNGQNTVCM